MTIYENLKTAKQQQQKKLAVLFDPDKMRLSQMEQALDLAINCGVDYFPQPTTFIRFLPSHPPLTRCF